MYNMEPKRFTTEELKQKYSTNSSVVQKSTPKRFTTEELKQKYSTEQPTETTNPSSKDDNMIQKLAVNLIGRPAIRASQAVVGLGVNAFGNEQQKQNYQKTVNEPVKLPMGLGTVDPVKQIGQGGGKQLAIETGKTALDIATVGAGSAINAGLKGLGTKVLPQLAKSKIGKGIISTGANIAEGLGYNTATNILNEKPLGENTGVVGVTSAVLPPIFKGLLPKQITSEMIDKDIRKAYQGVTGDVEKIDKMAYGSRKGLELLANESPNIKIPDSKAPLGSGATKPFDIKKADGNEFISAISKLRQKVVGNARTAVKEASVKGFTLKTDYAKNVITQAVNNGDITPATASRLYKQIDNTKGDAEKIFDWVQEVNTKYKNRFEKGTIDDMATSRIANDIAEGFRKELNTITDRTGYAESMSNIKDLERLLISVAKKANKGVNFGDITSEAGLDAGISLLTGNPVYMARTLGSGIFKGIVSKFKNTQGLRSVKSAISGISKIPNETKMPSAGLKQSRLMLPAPKAGTPTKSINTPINLAEKSQTSLDEAQAKLRKIDFLKRTKAKIYIPDKNIPKIKVENAPKGHSLNIGFNIGDGTRKLTEKQIIKEIKNLGVDIINSEVKQSGTEKTLIPQLSRELTETELGILAKKLEQDAIAQLSDGLGTLNGPKYKDWGGKFNEEYYLKPTKKKIDFEHYSVKKGLSELDPSFQFTGAKGSEGYLKNYPEFKTNYINLYKKGVKPEQLVLDAGGHKYSGSVYGSFLEVGTKEFKEIGEEARKFIENNEKYSKYDNKAMNAKFIELAKQKGYDGIEAENAVQYFNKINVDNKLYHAGKLGKLHNKTPLFTTLEKNAAKPYGKNINELNYKNGKIIDLGNKIEDRIFYGESPENIIPELNLPKETRYVDFLHPSLTEGGEPFKVRMSLYPKNDLSLKNKQKGSIQLGPLLGISGGIVGTGIALKNLPSSETIIERPKEAKTNGGDKLGNAIMQLESSGGTNKASADKGEMKWLTGLTEIAIKELKNKKLIDETFNKNNKDDIIDASIKYFNLMKKRNPNLSDAEIYVDKYWGQAKSKEQRQKKINEFNSLIK